MVAMIVDAAGVRAAAEPADLRRLVGEHKFFWLDLCDGDETARALYLSEIGAEPSEVAWAQRFGQAGRIHIGRRKLRAVTWLAEPAGNLIEVHVLASDRCIVTSWLGDAVALDDIRQQFAERACGIEKSPYDAAAILMQLLLGTLDHTIRSMDAALDDLRLRLDRDAAAIDIAFMTRRLQKLQTFAANFDRYSSGVRSAIVGIEAIDGMDAAAAAEFDDYVEHVEDVEEQFFERRRWLADLMHDHAAGVAQRQGEQINRLTLVSLIFLPVTALTGFFGMNFDWMSRLISSKAAFLVLGVALPLLSMAATISWLIHRGLIQIRWRPAGARPAGDVEDRGFFAAPRSETTSIADDARPAAAKLPG
jgi:Mg2+ and Co2+ transporter CorA